MKIKLTSILVDDQDKGLQYTSLSGLITAAQQPVAADGAARRR
jgi:hypothetical protein